MSSAALSEVYQAREDARSKVILAETAVEMARADLERAARSLVKAEGELVAAKDNARAANTAVDMAVELRSHPREGGCL